jgi:DNA-directed RNA polymerase I subunit RPA1
MKLPLRESISAEHTETFIKQVSRLTLSQVIERVTVTERLSSRDATEARMRKYTVLLEFYPPEEYRAEYEVLPDQIHESLAFNFAGTLKKEIQYEFRLATKVVAQDLAVGSGLKVRNEGGDDDGDDGEIGGRRGRDDELDDELGNDDGDAGQLKRQAQSRQHEYEADEDADDIQDMEDFIEQQGAVDDIQGKKRRLSAAGHEEDDEEGMDVDAANKAEADAKADMLAETFKTASKYASDFSFDVHGGKSAQFDLEVSLALAAR